MKTHSQIDRGSVGCEPVPARLNSSVAARKRLRSALEGPKTGTKKSVSCGFCSDSRPGSRHNIQGCQVRRSKGHHVAVGSEFQGLVSLLAGGRMAVVASHDLLTKKAILNAVPPQTQWLVIRGVFHTNSPGSVPAMEHLLLFVDCLGIGGIFLSEESYTECLVQMLGAYSWLGSKGARGTRSLSRVFIHPSWTIIAGRSDFLQCSYNWVCFVKDSVALSV